MIVRKLAREKLETYEAISSDELHSRMIKNNLSKKTSKSSPDLTPTIELLYYLYEKENKD